MENKKCKICNHQTTKIFDNLILKKYIVNYFQCSSCLFIQTEEPYWLEEAYLKAISVADTGLVSRNLSNSINLKIILPFLIKNPEKYKFLDYGSGYGILVRLMRDMGYNFFWYDKFCENLFAIGFEAKEKEKYKLVTAFELFEHFVEPIVEIQKILEFGNPDFLVFTTIIYKENIPDKNWWYYSFESGQHVSIYNINTLKFLANKFNYHLLTNNNNLHVFTMKNFSNNIFNLFLKYQKYVLKLIKHNLKSKTFDDHLYLKNQIGDRESFN